MPNYVTWVCAKLLDIAIDKTYWRPTSAIQIIQQAHYSLTSSWTCTTALILSVLFPICSGSRLGINEFLLLVSTNYLLIFYAGVQFEISTFGAVQQHARVW